MGAVALVTLVIGSLGGAHFANASMLYLVAVLASAIAFGRGPAILASVTAFAAFDWSFVEPLHQFTRQEQAIGIADLLDFDFHGRFSSHVIGIPSRQKCQKARYTSV